MNINLLSKIIMGRLLKKVCNIYFDIIDPYIFYIKKIKKINKINDINSRNIIITPFGGGYNHLFEGLFSIKAKINNYNIIFLICSGSCEYCEIINRELPNRKLRCILCIAKQYDFAKAFKGNYYTLSSLITYKDRKEVEKFIKSFFYSRDEHHKFLGIEIDKIIYSSLQRYYLQAEPIIENNKITHSFIRNSCFTLLVVDRLVKKFRPNYILTSHGIYSTWGSVLEYCKKNNIFVVTHGQNYNNYGIQFTYNDSYLTGDLNDRENKWMQKILTSKERSRSIMFLDKRMGRAAENAGVAFDYYRNNKNRLTKEQILDLLKIEKEQKIVGLFPNIPWDGDVRGLSTVFLNFKEWLRYTVDLFASRDDAVLVIRSHPAEVLRGDAAGSETVASMLQEMYEVLPQNVKLLGPLDQINSYTLGENSDFGISYASTVTLELIHVGTPVILCGYPPFKDKGIAFDVTSKDHYNTLIEEGINGKLIVTDERKEILYKFIHYFFFMRTMPQTLVSIKDSRIEKFLFKSEEELDKDPVFDELYHCIEEKREMDFSRFYD